MKIALVAATWQEIAPIQDYLSERLYLKNHHQFSLWVTGVGLVNTTYNLTKKIALKSQIWPFRQGSQAVFNHWLYSPGDVVAVKDEVMGDLGVIEANDTWNDIFDLKLADPNLFPFKSGKLPNPHHKLFQKINLPIVSAVSVNEITTSSKKIHQLIEHICPGHRIHGRRCISLCLPE